MQAKNTALLQQRSLYCENACGMLSVERSFPYANRRTRSVPRHVKGTGGT